MNQEIEGTGKSGHSNSGFTLFLPETRPSKEHWDVPHLEAVYILEVVRILLSILLFIKNFIYDLRPYRTGFLDFKISVNLVLLFSVFGTS